MQKANWESPYYLLRQATACLAASSKSVAVRMGRPLSFKIFLALSTLNPAEFRREEYHTIDISLQIQVKTK